MIGGLSVRITDTFAACYAKLPTEIRSEVELCVRDLQKEPVPGSRRLHSISPRGKRPIIYSVDVLPNKSYKLTFHIEGRVAVLRRVGTHKQIDRTS